MASVMFDETRAATGIIIPPELLTELVSGRPPHAVSRQTKAVLIHDEREAKPCFEVARDLRALDLKEHKHFRLATKIADVAMPHDEIARRRDRRPVHNLVLNVLMSRWNRDGDFFIRACHNGRNNFKTRLTKNDCHICISAAVLGICQLSLSRRKKIYARNFKVTLISVFRRACL